MKRKISQIFDTANSESVIQPVDLASQLLSVFIDGIQEVSAFEIKSLFESIASGEPFETIIAKYDYSFSDNPPNALNSYGFNLLLWAVLHERKDIVEALIEREFDVNAVHRLSISEDLTQTKYLSDAAFEHLQEIKQCTECETYRECMDGFEDPELFIINQYVEHTALTLASHLHSFEILSLLLSNGADRYQEVNQRSFGIDIEFDHSIMQQSPDFTVGLNALHFASLAHKETTNAHRVDCTIEALFDGLTDEQIIEYIKTPGADFRALELNTRTFWRLRFGGALEFSAQKNHRIFATLLSFGVTLRDNLVLEVCYEPDQSMPSNMKYTFLEYLMRLDDPAGCLYILKNFFDTSDLLEYVSDPHHRLFGSIAQWGEFFYEEDTAMSCDHLSDVFQEFRSLGISSRHPFSPFHAEDETLEHFFRELIVRKEEYLSHTISIFNPEDVVEDWCYIRLAFSDHSNIHSAVLEHYIKNSYNDYEPEYIRSKILEFRTLLDQYLNGAIDQDTFRSHFHSSKYSSPFGGHSQFAEIDVNLARLNDIEALPDYYTLQLNLFENIHDDSNVHAQHLLEECIKAVMSNDNSLGMGPNWGSTVLIPFRKIMESDRVLEKMDEIFRSNGLVRDGVMHSLDADQLTIAFNRINKIVTQVINLESDMEEKPFTRFIKDRIHKYIWLLKPVDIFKNHDIRDQLIKMYKSDDTKVKRPLQAYLNADNAVKYHREIFPEECNPLVDVLLVKSGLNLDSPLINCFFEGRIKDYLAVYSDFANTPISFFGKKQCDDSDKRQLDHELFDHIRGFLHGN